MNWDALRTMLVVVVVVVVDDTMIKRVGVMGYDYSVVDVHRSVRDSPETDEAVVKVFFLVRWDFCREEGFCLGRAVANLCDHLHDDGMEAIDYGFCYSFFLIFCWSCCYYGGDGNQDCSFCYDYDYSYNFSHHDHVFYLDYGYDYGYRY